MRLRLYVVVVSLDTHSSGNIFGDKMVKTENRKEREKKGRLLGWLWALTNATRTRL